MKSEPPALDTLATPLLWADLRGEILGANPAFGSWLGVSARRLLGLSITDLDVEQGRLADVLQRLSPAGELLRVRRARLAFPGNDEYFADLLLARSQDGGIRLEAHPTEEFPGEDPATALPAALSAALRGLAHELRNPLAGLKGSAQLLSRRIDSAGSQELIRLISDEAQRLETLVDRLLNPAPPTPFAALNIHAALEKVRQLAEAEAGWAVKIHRDYDPSLPDLLGDIDRLTQALWNLLRNAMQAQASQINIRTRAEHHVLIGDIAHKLIVRVDIADNGHGVPDDLTERLFLPLVSGRADGSGLGLPFAQQIAREHGGSLGYRSRPGHTVFTLLLPVPEAEPGTDQTTNQETKP